MDQIAMRIVAGHTGAPWNQEIISLAAKFPSVYLDTSAYKARRYRTAAACLEGLDALGLSPEATAMFLYENVRRVFRLAAA